jgi:hypothetical protein
MKRLVAGALAVAVVSGGIWAAQTWATQRYKASAADTDQAVMFADQTLRRAIATGDKTSIGILLDRRFTFTDRTGRNLVKAQFVLNPAASAGDSDDATVRRYGRVAVVTGSSGTDAGPDTFFVHVWLKRRGGWRAFAFHDSAPAAGAARPAAELAGWAPCENPCKRVPYLPKSPAEQDIVAAFQAVETAIAGNDADAWAQNIADEYRIYRSNARPGTKADRAAYIKARKDAGTPTRVGELISMQLWVFGDAAVMAAQHAWPESRLPPYRVTRLWVRRDGRWQLTLSQQTTMEP